MPRLVFLHLDHALVRRVANDMLKLDGGVANAEFPGQPVVNSAQNRIDFRN